MVDLSHLHDEEETGNDDVGEVARQEGEKEGGQNAVLCAHAESCYRSLEIVIDFVIDWY